MLFLNAKLPLIFFMVLILQAVSGAPRAESLPTGGAAVTKNNANRAAVKKRNPAARKSKKRKRGCSCYASAKYRRMVRNWQKVPKIPKPKFRDGYRELVLYSVNHGERIRIFPFSADGSIDPEAHLAIQHLLRDKDTDAEHAIHPRLIKLLYRTADEFNARQINVVSGYRASTEDKKEGNHRLGRAVDFMVPGTPLGAIAKKARSFGHTGVGFYPVSGFVHMDVRDGPSYFWIDRSGPGKTACLRRIYAESAAKSDRKWKPQNDEPTVHKNKKGEILHDVKMPPRAVSEGRSPTTATSAKKS
jgi:uncharacterized protein YcbK (DUF882 family)